MPWKNKEKQRAYEREHYKNNKQYYKDKAKRWDKKQSMMIRKFKIENPCIKCGENDWRCLTFAHRDPKTKLFDVSTGAGNGYGTKKLMNEIKKCDVLCFNCHMKDTYDY